MPEQKTRVGVIFGGISSEREASLASGRQVHSHLDGTKYTPVAIFMDTEGRLWELPQKLVLLNTTQDIVPRLDEATRIPYQKLPERIDVAFIALHGKYGDDGCIQGLLELLAVPYTGSGVLASAVCMDKPMAHRVLAYHDVAVAREIVIEQAAFQRHGDALRRRIADEIGLPCVIKPTREGSSVGVSVVESEDAIDGALAAAFVWDTAAIVEERLEGLEFSSIVLGTETPAALPPTETVTDNPYLTYDDKYMPGRSQKITPARVPAETLKRMQEEVLKAYRKLGFSNYGRIDGFLLNGDRVLITDPNTTSGMSPSSFMFHQAAEIGLTAPELFDRIIEDAVELHRQKRGPL
ncbi:MAG: D-alanine--D-alanine ligase [Anaerolineae bacterium]